jgi:hypothetical protein
LVEGAPAGAAETQIHVSRAACGIDIESARTDRCRNPDGGSPARREGGHVLMTEVAHSDQLDPAAAVADLLRQLEHARPGLAPVAAVFFCDGLYSLQRLANRLQAAFVCPLMGCTSGGQIGPGGFRRGGISLLACYGPALTLRPYLIEPVDGAEAGAARIAAELAMQPPLPGRRRFGLLLVDGLRQGEEQLAHSLYHGLGDLPFVGGSASDGMRFEHTPVYFEGRFRSNAAVFGVFETSAEFMAFRVQNFAPRQRRLVITEADTERRLVTQINGLPAAEVYAEVLGVAESALEPSLLEAHPLLVRVGNESVARAICRVTRSRALQCMAAVDQGVLVDVGDVLSPLASLEQGFEHVRARLGEPALVLGFECILRRRQAERDRGDHHVGEFLAAQRVFGFATHGEQFNGLHINQTFTAIALGGR